MLKLLRQLQDLALMSLVLLAVSAYVHWRYASKELIDVLHHLGIAEGYDEIQLLIEAFLEAGDTQHNFISFLQTV